jgi:hypothetical protein
VINEEELQFAVETIIKSDNELLINLKILYLPKTDFIF